MDIFTILFLPRSGRLKWDGRVGAMPLVRLTSLLPFSPRFLAQVSPSAVSGLSPEEAKIRGGLPSSSPLFKGVKEKHAAIAAAELLSTSVMQTVIGDSLTEGWIRPRRPNH